MKELKTWLLWASIAFMVAVSFEAGKDSYRYFNPSEPIVVIHKTEVKVVVEDCEGGCG